MFPFALMKPADSKTIAIRLIGITLHIQPCKLQGCNTPYISLLVDIVKRRFLILERESLEPYCYNSGCARMTSLVLPIYDYDLLPKIK